MPKIEENITLTPRQYELVVKSILDGSGLSLEQYSSAHLEKVAGVDGQYIIDVTVRFSALGADFLVLVECKHEKRRVERQDVQVLQAKMASAGAQKGMLFSIAGFQQGAIEYADVHGVALVQLATGSSTWVTRSAGPPMPPPPWAQIPEYVGWWCHGNTMSVMSSDIGEYTLMALGVAKDDPLPVKKASPGKPSATPHAKR